jgi:hypothetical protein
MDKRLDCLLWDLVDYGILPLQVYFKVANILGWHEQKAAIGTSLALSLVR